MLIEQTKRTIRNVGAANESIIEVNRFEWPDPAVLDLHLDVGVSADPVDAHEFLAARTHWRTLPLWAFLRDFLAHEFPYLGLHGAEEMADRFQARWRSRHND